ncbi:Uncharacterized protein Fot_24022 [Forsythia ovata]|uniref:XS domain-containing protein n=1 Tax=Forsythia ovata TaxID=205694 RepID=A0ABD1U523_9LAMI
MSNRFETTFLTAWDEFMVNECKTVTTMVGAALIILARNLRVSSFNGKIPLCQLCAILLYPEVDDNLEILETVISRKNYLSSRTASISPPPSNKIVHLKDIPYLFTKENQDILNDIRASTTEEYMLYLKVIYNNKKIAALKYDVVFMLEPILDINKALNIGENSVRGFMVEEKSAYRTCINKQPIKAYALPVLSPIDPVSGRQNAKHTCFKTNTVIASRNITDLYLVANIANQSDFIMADTNDGARIVKPWTVIVANLPVRTENNIRVDNCNINLKQRWKTHGYLINNFQPLYDYRAHSGFALIECSRDIEGLKSAFLFDLSYVEKRKEKAEWEEALEQTDKLFTWMAYEEDYNKNDIVGYNLTNGRDLTSIPNIHMQEARHYRMVLYNLRESLHTIAQNIHRSEFVSRFQILIQMVDKHEESIENFASIDFELLDMVDDGLAIQSKLHELKISIDDLYNTFND